MRRVWRGFQHFIHVIFWDWMRGPDLNDSFEAARRFKD